MAGLTGKQERFIAEFLIDLNATQAAIRAGYSADTAYSIGSENLKKPEILNAIAEARAKIATMLEVTAERIIAEYAKLGFSNMAHYTRIHHGDPYIDLSAVSLDQFAAIAEVTSEDYTEGRGEDSRDIKKTKIKLHDKKGALDSLARHLGMFNDKSTVDLNVTDLTPEQRESEIRSIIANIAGNSKSG